MAEAAPVSPNVWLGRSGPIAKNIGQPLHRFMQIEAAGGVVLIAATIIALVWANSPLQDSYYDFWFTHIDLHVGSIEIFSHDMSHFVNDALMTLFFFVVGMEIKREMVVGELNEPRKVALPAMAALGGMAVPAGVYMIFNSSGDGLMDGWGIPMATDIAFAMGIVSLLGTRVSHTLKIFLLSLAIADDIGSILVIAIFYTNKLSIAWLIVAIATLFLIRFMAYMRIWWFPIYIFVGVFAWWAMYNSGVHATIAGVALGLLAPARPLVSFKEARDTAQWLETKRRIFIADIRWSNFNIQESVSVAERLVTKLHPFVTFVILPIFALANAGVVLSSDSLSDAVSSRVALGIGLGLLAGKTVGITFFTWLAVKLKIAELPEFVTKFQVLAVSVLAGIGFTVALFITALAFPEDDGIFGGGLVNNPLVEAAASSAKISILVASLIAASVGLWLLAKACPHKSHERERPAEVIE